VIAATALAVVLAASAADLCGSPSPDPATCSPTADPVLRALVAPHLGAIDRPVPVEAWRRLPPAARDYLEALAADPTALPSRRARALEGAAALGTGGAVHRRLAEETGAPFVVRSAAVRGLGGLPAAARGRELLTALLTRDADRRIRAAAAETLARSSPAESCAAIRAQAGLEATDGRQAFRHALTACGAR
jgi:HEAT repeat protein